MLSLEHPHIYGLVTGARHEETAQLLTSLFLRSRSLRGFETLGTSLGCDRRGQIGHLLRAQCDQLVAGLGCLQRSGAD